MRILWISNPPWSGSGYGEQTALFVPRLKALGHDLACMANWGLQGAVFDWHGLTVYPSDANWGNKSAGTYARQHEADLVIALCDAWVLHPDQWPDDLKMAVWAPIDHYPVPPSVLSTLADDRVTPIAMSRFGEKQMRDLALEPAYIPHGINTEVFRPKPGMREQVRDTIGIPQDAFLVGMVAANKSQMVHRKSFPQAFHAFARFAKEHKDAWLYAHTEANAGMDLERLVKVLGLVEGLPQNRVRFPGQKAWDLGMSQEIVSNIYQAFDVLLSPSMGEGFGIPILEAQACGVPVICSDHSAMTELCQAGWLVDGDPWWDEPSCAFFFIPRIDSIAAALEAAYDSRADMELREAAATFALQYDADLVTETYWEPFLARMEPRKESRQVRRARERREAKVAA